VSQSLGKDVKIEDIKPEVFEIEEVKMRLDKVESLFNIPKLIIVDSCRGNLANRPKTGFLLPTRDEVSRHGNICLAGMPKLR
jgi:hypothetical protein